MSDSSQIAAGTRRGVRALIQTLGATTVQLCIPAPPVAGDSGEELGLRAPEFQWKPLEPVAVRRGKVVEVLVAADVLENVLGLSESSAVAAAMAALAAVQMGAEVFVPTATEAVPCRGGVCMYRIALRAEPAEAA